MKIFFDMDDTLAKFSVVPHYIERMHDKGFFRNLEPYKMAKDIAKLNNYDNIYILSACVKNEYCRQEKIEWIKEHIPNFPLSHIVLCNVGENKAEKVDCGKEPYFLVDDYSRNIIEWEQASACNIAIKRINGFNNKSGRIYNYTARTLRQVFTIIKGNI